MMRIIEISCGLLDRLQWVLRALMELGGTRDAGFGKCKGCINWRLYKSGRGKGRGMAWHGIVWRVVPGVLHE